MCSTEYSLANALLSMYSFRNSWEELMKDLIIDDLRLKVGICKLFTYRLEIEDTNKLNLQRYQCQMPADDLEAKLHSQGLKVRCLADCKDEIENRIPCNCTELNGFRVKTNLPDCQHIFTDDLQMKNIW